MQFCFYHPDFTHKIIESNKDFPTILTDEKDNIIAIRNLDPVKVRDNKFLERKLQLMKRQNQPIKIEVGAGQKQFLYYQNIYHKKYI